MKRAFTIIRPRQLCPLLLAAGLCSATPILADPPGVEPLESKLYPGATASLMLDLEDTGKGYVAVGERGHILVSDEGRSWSQVVAPTDSTLTAVSFAGEHHGWVVGHDAAILHTEDGGKTWSLQHFEPTGAGPLLDVQFESRTHGFAVGAFGTFLETSDGGKTWSPVDAPVVAEAGAHLYSITQIANGRWLIVGEMGFIAMSEDGQEWSGVESPYYGSLYAAAPLGDEGAVLVGMRGNAFMARDLRAGEWTSFKTGTVLSLTSVTRTNAEEYLVTTLNRQLLKLTVAGQAEVLHLPESADQASNTGSYNDVLILNDELLIASDHGIFRTALPGTQVTLAPHP